MHGVATRCGGEAEDAVSSVRPQHQSYVDPCVFVLVEVEIALFDANIPVVRFQRSPLRVAVH